MSKKGKRTFLYTFLMQVTMCKKVYLFVRFGKEQLNGRIQLHNEKIPVAKNDGYTYNIDEEYCSLV